MLRENAEKRAKRANAGESSPTANDNYDPRRAKVRRKVPLPVLGAVIVVLVFLLAFANQSQSNNQNSVKTAESKEPQLRKRTSSADSSCTCQLSSTAIGNCVASHSSFDNLKFQVRFGLLPPVSKDTQVTVSTRHVI